MRILQRWLNSIESVEVKRQLFALLSTLPVATKNVIDTARILPDVEHACDADDPELAEIAAKLKAKWATLKTVYVISKAETETELVPIPRIRLRQFNSMRLQEIGHASGALRCSALHGAFDRGFFRQPL